MTATKISDLRAEGVFEVGAVSGSSIAFVVTEERVMLVHFSDIPCRKLDAYGAGVAIAALQSGGRQLRIAAGLGVTEDELRRATRALGYSPRPSCLAKATTRH